MPAPMKYGVQIICMFRNLPFILRLVFAIAVWVLPEAELLEGCFFRRERNRCGYLERNIYEPATLRRQRQPIVGRPSIQ